MGNLLAVLSNRNIWIMLVKYLASSDHVMVMMKLITMTMITMIITMMANITLRRDVEVDVEMIWICQGCLNVSAGKASLDHLPTGSSNIFHQLGLSLFQLCKELLWWWCAIIHYSSTTPLSFKNFTHPRATLGTLREHPHHLQSPDVLLKSQMF